MAGDWIKMRSNLWDDPRVSRMCDLTDNREAAIIGGLYWLWASADQHTETGAMPGLSLKQINRKTGIKGFAEALCDVGWLEDHPDGVIITHFEEHNGASAKKRAQTAKRVANHKSGNAEVTQKAENANAPSVSSALPREREREEKEINPAATVIAQAWWPSSETLLALRANHGYAEDWIDRQVPSFVAYWLDRNEPRPSWDALFIQHCEQRARRSA